MKNKQIMIILFVLVLLYFLLKQVTTNVVSSIGGSTSPGTTTKSNALGDLLGKIFTQKPKPPSNIALQPTLAQLGTLQAPTFDFSYCGVSSRVIDPANGVKVNWCIDAATGDTYSLDQFPNGNVPFKILSDPNQIVLSEDMNGLTSNAYNADTTAANHPTQALFTI
jgi:hypothetical protein